VRTGPDEEALFRAAVEDVAPLSDRDRRRPPRPAGRARADAPERRDSSAFVVEADGGGRAPGVNRRTLADLAAGRTPIQATLDLHRHTFASAREHLARFLAESRSAGLRCVLVITGKAERAPADARLRDQVPGWLAGPLSGSVAAFCPARPEHGGAGALYVLLRGARR